MSFTRFTHNERIVALQRASHLKTIEIPKASRDYQVGNSDEEEARWKKWFDLKDELKDLIAKLSPTSSLRSIQIILTKSLEVVMTQRDSWKELVSKSEQETPLEAVEAKENVEVDEKVELEEKIETKDPSPSPTTNIKMTYREFYHLLNNFNIKEENPNWKTACHKINASDLRRLSTHGVDNTMGINFFDVVLVHLRTLKTDEQEIRVQAQIKEHETKFINAAHHDDVEIFKQYDDMFTQRRIQYTQLNAEIIQRERDAESSREKCWTEMDKMTRLHYQAQEFKVSYRQARLEEGGDEDQEDSDASNGSGYWRQKMEECNMKFDQQIRQAFNHHGQWKQQAKLLQSAWEERQEELDASSISLSSEFANYVFDRGVRLVVFEFDGVIRPEKLSDEHMNELNRDLLVFDERERMYLDSFMFHVAALQQLNIRVSVLCKNRIRRVHPWFSHANNEKISQKDLLKNINVLPLHSPWEEERDFPMDVKHDAHGRGKPGVQSNGILMALGRVHGVNNPQEILLVDNDNRSSSSISLQPRNIDSSIDCWRRADGATMHVEKGNDTSSWLHCIDPSHWPPRIPDRLDDPFRQGFRQWAAVCESANAQTWLQQKTPTNKGVLFCLWCDDMCVENKDDSQHCHCCTKKGCVVKFADAAVIGAAKMKDQNKLRRLDSTVLLKPPELVTISNKIPGPHPAPAEAKNNNGPPKMPKTPHSKIDYLTQLLTPQKTLVPGAAAAAASTSVALAPTFAPAFAPAPAESKSQRPVARCSLKIAWSFGPLANGQSIDKYLEIKNSKFNRKTQVQSIMEMIHYETQVIARRKFNHSNAASAGVGKPILQRLLSHQQMRMSPEHTLDDYLPFHSNGLLAKDILLTCYKVTSEEYQRYENFLNWSKESVKDCSFLECLQKFHYLYSGEPWSDPNYVNRHVYTFPYFQKIGIQRLSQIKIEGLSFKITENTIRQAFARKLGLQMDRIEVNLERDEKTHASKGSAFVTFEHEELVVRALREMQGFVLEGENGKKDKQHKKKKKKKKTGGTYINHIPETIDDALSLYGLVSYDVGAEGDCQFRALAYHLRVTHAEVRARVVTEMRDYKQRYVAFAEQWDVPESGEVRYGCSYDEFVDRMAEQGEWGLNTTLKAAANAFQRQLHIVSLTVQGQSYYQTVIPEEVNNNEDADIWLAFLDGCHYRATKLLPGSTFSVPEGAKEEELDIFPASILRLTHTRNSMRPMRHYCYDQRGHPITFKEDGMIKHKMTNEVVHSEHEINCYCGQVYWAWSLGQANDWSREKTLQCLRMIMMGKYEFDMRREEIYRESGRTVTIHDVVRDDDSWQLRRVELEHFISDQWFVTISSDDVSEVSNDDVPMNEETKEYEEPFFHIHHVPYDVQEGVIWTHSLHRPEKISLRLPPVESCCQMLRRVVCDTNLLKRWFKWIVGKCSAESDDDDVNWQHGVEMHEEEEKKEQ